MYITNTLMLLFVFPYQRVWYYYHPRKVLDPTQIRTRSDTGVSGLEPVRPDPVLPGLIPGVGRGGDEPNTNLNYPLRSSVHSWGSATDRGPGRDRTGDGVSSSPHSGRVSSTEELPGPLGTCSRRRDPGPPSTPAQDETTWTGVPGAENLCRGPPVVTRRNVGVLSCFDLSRLSVLTVPSMP